MAKDGPKNETEYQDWLQGLSELPAVGPVMQANPLFAQNQYEPSSYIPAVAVGDPKLAQPLPSGQYADARMNSVIADRTAKMTQDLRSDPKKFVEDNTQQLNNEQSLLDKGASFAQRLFDYKDEPDWELFGVNLKAVESTFDTFMRYFTGSQDLLSIGRGGIISAMPGGVQTYSFDQLSGGADVGQVLSGEMDYTKAPSAGQIAVTSVGIEAKRIREGGGRISDLLLLNPATAPFVVAALAADTSPVQADNFDLLNNEQRTKAFGSGWEQWMSGITDTGLMFADPTIAAGVALKVTKLGLLGQLGNRTYTLNMAAASDRAVIALDEAVGATKSTAESIDEIIAAGEARLAAGEVRGGTVSQAASQAGPVVLPKLPTYVVGMEIDKIKDPLAKFIAQTLETDEAGNKVLTALEISGRTEFDALPNKSIMGTLLHQSDSFGTSALIIKSLSGDAKAHKALEFLDAGIADTVFRFKREQAFALAQMEPQKVETVLKALSASIDNLKSQADSISAQIAERTSEGGVLVKNVEDAPDVVGLKDQLKVFQQNIDEAEELFLITSGEKVVDGLDATSPFYKPKAAEAIIDSLMSRQNLVGETIRSAIEGEALTARFQLPSTTNAYARAVYASRTRNAKGKYQYAAEGTSILPKKKQIAFVNGEVIKERSGWFAASSFDGTSRFQRNVRVWRWVGDSTPSGYLGYKGISSVGSETEFRAATNTELYRGAPVKVTQADGTIKEYGGRIRQDELNEMFLKGLNDPEVDSFSVVKEIETEIAKDYAAAYGQSKGSFANMLRRADRMRESTQEQIRTAGYFADAKGDVQAMPYAQTALANGTYMHNWHALESILDREVSSGGAAKLARMLEAPAHYANSGMQLFESFWRPATLLRLSYTQRNVFEGMIRSMAYQASLAPLTWPVRATTNGIRNSVVKKVATSRTVKAQKAVNDSEYGVAVRELGNAEDELYKLQTAVEQQFEGEAVPSMYVFTRKDGQGVETRMSMADYERALAKADDRVEELKSSVGLRTEEFTKAVAGTKFGKWRETQLKALDAQILEDKKVIDILTEAIGTSTMDRSTINNMASIAQMNASLVVRRRMLESDSIRSLAEYRTIIGRQKRIGSGTSLGPDANFYANAFEDPYEALTRAAVSSDTTRKQTLSLVADTWNSVLMKQLVKEHQAVMYTPNNAAIMKAWKQGMVEAIEEASSNPVVRELLNRNWDVDSVVAWFRTPEGRRVYASLDHILSSPKIDDGTEGIAAGTAAKEIVHERFGEDVKQVSGGRPLLAINDELAAVYVTELKNITLQQMQNSSVFVNLLASRAQVKSISRMAPLDKPAAITGVQGVTDKDIDLALNQLGEEGRSSLGYIMGSETINMGTDRAINVYRSVVSKMFDALGTIPEDAVTRGPFYASRFRASRDTLIEQFLIRSGQGGALTSKKARRQLGIADSDRISPENVRIPAKEMDRIRYSSHRRALADTREWLYTIERRTNLGKRGEWILPFISAQQNSVTVIGKLLYKEPWLAPLVADLWRAPDRLGIVNEDGNITMPMPFTWVQSYLQDRPDIPFVGGIIDSIDTLTIPKDSFNVVMPESGFGVLPRPTPWVQVSASELMKANLISLETPQLVKNMFGDESGDAIWQSLQDWVFGEEGAISSKTASVDKVLPAAWQKIWASKDEMSEQYVREFALQKHTQDLRTYSRERDDFATPEEINKRTTNAFLFGALGNIGVPTPLTPYPILGRPAITKPAVEAMQDIQKLYKQADPKLAGMNMMTQFGDWALPTAASAVTKNVGGADPTAATVSDIKTLDSLIAQVSPLVGDQYDVMGILINNRNDMNTYDRSAVQYEKATRIAGTSSNYIEPMTFEEAIAETQRDNGWTKYRMFMDQLRAMMFSAGVKSTESSAGAPYKNAKDIFIGQMLGNPDFTAWKVDYKDNGASRTLSANRVIEAAAFDPKFNRLMLENGKTQLLSNMKEYVYYRRGVVIALNQSGHGIDHESNALVKAAWGNIRLRLVNSDVRWAEISDLYLTDDDNPAFDGIFTDINQPIPAELKAS